MTAVDCTFERHGSQVQAIFNEVIAHSTALYDYTPRSLESVERWFEGRAAAGLPVVGAEDGSPRGRSVSGPVGPRGAIDYIPTWTSFGGRTRSMRGLGAPGIELRYAGTTVLRTKPMRAVDLRQVDLNLLVPLAVLLRERHITRAARAVGLSQPAMSRALARLRELFGDELLVSAGGSLQRTPRGDQLMQALEGVLEGVMGLLDGAPFDPAQARGEVVIAAFDVMAYKLLPHVMQALAERAPGLSLRVCAWRPDYRAHLCSGEVELTIGHPRGDEPDLYQQPLVTTEWASVLRVGHPALAKPWDLDAFCSLRHLLVSVDGRGGGQVDDALAELGRRREVALRVPFPLVTPLLVAESDLVLTTSRWLATKMAEAVDLVVLEPPVALEPMPLPMVWHARTHHDPRARWVRGLLAEAAARVPGHMLRASAQQ